MSYSKRCLFSIQASALEFQRIGMTVITIMIINIYIAHFFEITLSATVTYFACVK